MFYSLICPLLLSQFLLVQSLASSYEYHIHNYNNGAVVVADGQIDEIVEVIVASKDEGFALNSVFTPSTFRFVVDRLVALRVDCLHQRPTRRP